MDINLIAKLKDKKEFINNFKQEDVNRVLKGKSILFYALSNNNLNARYEITNYLLDSGSNVSVLNEENETLLHILLSRPIHDLDETIKLSKRLILLGTNVNQLDKKID